MSEEAFTQLCREACDVTPAGATEGDYWQSIHLAACRYFNEEPDVTVDPRLSLRQNSRRALHELEQRHGEAGRALLIIAEREIAATLQRRTAGGEDARAASASVRATSSDNGTATKKKGGRK